MLMNIIFLCLLALVLSVANKFIKVAFFNFNEATALSTSSAPATFWLEYKVNKKYRIYRNEYK